MQGDELQSQAAQSPGEGRRRRRWWMAGIALFSVAALVIAVPAAIAYVKRDAAYRVLFDCPSESWAETAKATMLAVVPESATEPEEFTWDCDDLRNVNLAFEVPDGPAAVSGMVTALEAEGWSRVNGSICLEREMAGRTSAITVYLPDDPDRAVIEMGASGFPCE